MFLLLAIRYVQVEGAGNAVISYLRGADHYFLHTHRPTP
jgi:hypothetical protein